MNLFRICSSTIALSVVLIMTGCASTPKAESNNTEAASTPVENTVVAETNEQPEPSITNTPSSTSDNFKQAFYVAEKKGSKTTVYTEYPDTGDRKELFSFKESSSLDPQSGNTYEGLSPAVDYSSIKNEFVYAAVDGVYVYDLKAGKNTSLIHQIGTQGEMDGIPIPSWEAQSKKLNIKPFSFVYPQYSDTGEYISVTGAFYEGLSTYILNRETAEVIPLDSKNEEESIGRYLLDWHDNQLVIAADNGGYTYPGLFVVTDEKFSFATDILQIDSQTKTFPEGRAVFVGVNAILYNFQDESGEGNYETSGLAIIHTDGTGQKVLVEDGAKVHLYLGAKDGAIFTKNSTEESQSGIWKIDPLTNTQEQLTTGAGAADDIPLFYDSEEGLLSIAQINDDKESIVIVDINTQKALYTSEYSAVPRAHRFLGWASE